MYECLQPIKPRAFFSTAGDVEEELLVTIGSREARATHALQIGVKRFHDEGASLQKHPAMNVGISHYPPFAYQFRAGFELGLYEDDAVERRRHTTYHRWQDLGYRDERDIHGDQVGLKRQHLGHEVTSIDPLEDMHTVVAAKSVVQLAATDIESDHSLCSRLQQAINETSRGRTHV